MGAMSDLLMSQLGIDPKEIGKIGSQIGTTLADFQQRLTRIEAKLDTILEIIQHGENSTASGRGKGERADGSGPA